MDGGIGGGGRGWGNGVMGIEGRDREVRCGGQESGG